MRVALVHEWLDTWGGGEAVLAELLRVFPGADVYTLVDFLRRRTGRVSAPFRSRPRPLPQSPPRAAGSATRRCCVRR